MSDAPVQVRDLRKEFVLHHTGAGGLKSLILRRRRASMERLEVLKGVSFDVNEGECLAVVGRNGAGKSTLLALLARVYRPSAGEIRLNGRIAPLLELGAGFHPDLTGLENIFFNGVILGLTRKEIAERLDRIVAFSELERQIDTPVRTFSSGMIARLGFSVAVHMDAKILLVDEVLAVGDFEFAEKCYRTIEDFRNRGGSILFVSHQVDAIERVADRCLWLQDGLVKAIGPTSEVLPQYVSASGGHLPAP